MLANATLPDSVPQQEIISARVFVPYVERLAKLAGVSYSGPQVMEDDTLHYFREPITGSSIAVWDLSLSLESLIDGIQACRVRFGVA